MTFVVVLFGVAILGVGGFGLVRPAGLIDVLESTWKSPVAFPVAIGIRVVLGVALWYAAPDCRHPDTVRVIGVIALVAAVAALVLGRARISDFLAWWIGRSVGFVRVWAGVAMGFGGFLVYTAA